jgi:hypothetical protein
MITLNIIELNGERKVDFSALSEADKEILKAMPCRMDANHAYYYEPGEAFPTPDLGGDLPEEPAAVDLSNIDLNTLTDDQLQFLANKIKQFI